MRLFRRGANAVARRGGGEVGLEEVVAEIRGAGRREEETILAGAQQRAAELLARAEKEARRLREDFRRRGQQEAERAAFRAMAAAGQQRRKMLLAAQRQLLEQAYQELLAAAAKLPEAARGQLVRRLAEQVEKAAPESTVHLRAEEQKFLEGKTRLKIGAAQEMLGGLVAVSPDGKRRIDLRLEHLLHVQWQERLAEIARELFPAEEGAGEAAR